MVIDTPIPPNEVPAIENIIKIPNISNRIYAKVRIEYPPYPSQTRQSYDRENRHIREYRFYSRTTFDLLQIEFFRLIFIRQELAVELAQHKYGEYWIADTPNECNLGEQSCRIDGPFVHFSQSGSSGCRGLFRRRFGLFRRFGHKEE